MNELEFLKDFDISLLYIAFGFTIFLISIITSISLRKSNRVNEQKIETEKAKATEVESSKIPDLIKVPDTKKEDTKKEDIKKEEIKDDTLLLKLKKTSLKFTEGIKNLTNKKSQISENYDSLEELLIEADVGVNTSNKLITLLKENIKNNQSDKNDEILIRNTLKSIVKTILTSEINPEIEPEKVGELPKVILVVGVNGAGKTTSIGKLAFQFRAQGAKVLVAACDTFRAAASDQLRVWVERAGAELEEGVDGEKPSTVAFRAVNRAKTENFDVLLVDTAGRLHTKQNLMQELGSITKIISRECSNAPHETILVVDGSSGQNALHQAREFNEVTSLTGIIITKLDGTPRGGVVIGIKNELNIPIRYIGLGESTADLRIFDATEFTDALFYIEEKEELNYKIAND